MRMFRDCGGMVIRVGAALISRLNRKILVDELANPDVAYFGASCGNPTELFR
jgi:hypothetical protein